MLLELANGQNAPIVLADNAKVRTGENGLTIEQWGGAVNVQAMDIADAAYGRFIPQGNIAGQFGALVKRSHASPAAALQHFQLLHALIGTQDELKLTVATTAFIMPAACLRSVDIVGEVTAYLQLRLRFEITEVRLNDSETPENEQNP